MKLIGKYATKFIRVYMMILKLKCYKDAQRHWIGQYYRIVNSKTKLNQNSQIYKIGKIYTFDELRAFMILK